jgi:drug/metabolite transporter (DMT)-like permease
LILYLFGVVDVDTVNDLRSAAIAAVPAGFAGSPAADRFVGNIGRDGRLGKQMVVVHVVAVLCVVGLASGQILFKVGATSLSETGSLCAARTAAALLAALAIYAITTIAWVWVLQKIDLGRVYPVMALAFVLVPLASYVFLGERFQPHYFFGVALIVVGIVVAVRTC